MEENINLDKYKVHVGKMLRQRVPIEEILLALGGKHNELVDYVATIQMAPPEPELIPINYPEFISKEYSGDVLEPDIDSEVNYTLVRDPEDDRELINAGDYKFIATPNQGFCWSFDGSTNPYEIIFTITKKGIEVPQHVFEKEYDPDSEQFVVPQGEGYTIEYLDYQINNPNIPTQPEENPDDNINDEPSDEPSDEPEEDNSQNNQSIPRKDVGIWNFKLILDDNYYWISEEFEHDAEIQGTITIYRKSIEVPIIPNKSAGQIYNLTDTVEYSFNINSYGPDAGEYPIVAKLNKNYKWSNNENGGETDDYEFVAILEILGLVNKPVFGQQTYGSVNLNFTDKPGYKIYESEDSETSINSNITDLNAGSYTYYAKLNPNYYWNDNTNDILEISVNVAKKQISIPNQASFVYDGTDKTCFSELNGEGWSIPDDGSGGTFKARDAGEYTATAYADSNHIFDTGETKSITWKILRAIISIDTSYAVDKYYNGSHQDQIISNNINDDRYSISFARGKYVGTYNDTFASINNNYCFDNNQQDTEEIPLEECMRIVSWKIKKATPELVWEVRPIAEGYVGVHVSWKAKFGGELAELAKEEMTIENNLGFTFDIPGNKIIKVYANETANFNRVEETFNINIQEIPVEIGSVNIDDVSDLCDDLGVTPMDLTYMQLHPLLNNIKSVSGPYTVTGNRVVVIYPANKIVTLTDALQAVYINTSFAHTSDNRNIVFYSISNGTDININIV